MDVDECDLSACFGELSVSEVDMKAVTTGVQTDDCVGLENDMLGADRNLAETIIEIAQKYRAI